MGGPDRRSSSRIHRWHVRPALLRSWLVMHVAARGERATTLAKKFKKFGMQQMTQSGDGFIAGFPWLITKAREKAYDIHSNYPFLFCLNSLLALTSLTSFFHFVWFAGSGSGEAVAGALWPRRWQLHISHVQGQNSVACTTSCIPHLSPLPSLSS